jgi:hypothetical protein
MGDIGDVQLVVGRPGGVGEGEGAARGGLDHAGQVPHRLSSRRRVVDVVDADLVSVGVLGVELVPVAGELVPDPVETLDAVAEDG